MTEKPIIFSAPMVRALLEGRKTQTRRVLKPQPPTDAHMVRCYTDNPPRPALRNTVGWFVPEAGDLWPCDDTDRIRLPYAPDDRLWVREAFKVGNDLAPDLDLPTMWVFRATSGDPTGPWRSPIHMSRRASRLTLTVTDVRVQRLNSLTEDDAQAEGVSGIEDFADLWNSLHGPDAWGANPWVVALTFTVHRRNIDQMEAAA